MLTIPDQKRGNRHGKLSDLLCCVSLAGSVGVLMCSCVHRGNPPSAPASPAAKTVAKAKKAPALRTIEPLPVSPEQRLGVVKVIGAHGSFVLIETPSASATAAVTNGALLHCRPPGVVSGGSSADLRVSPERRQPFLVADVLSGLPSVGDTVYLAKDAMPTVSPLRPVAPYSSVVPAAGPPPMPEPTP